MSDSSYIENELLEANTIDQVDTDANRRSIIASTAQTLHIFQLVVPKPCFVIKAKVKSQDLKVFINICCHEKIPFNPEIGTFKPDKVIYLLVGLLRETKAKEGGMATVCDVAIGPQESGAAEYDTTGVYRTRLCAATLEALRTIHDLDLGGDYSNPNITGHYKSCAHDPPAFVSPLYVPAVDYFLNGSAMAIAFRHILDMSTSTVPLITSKPQSSSAAQSGGSSSQPQTSFSSFSSNPKTVVEACASLLYGNALKEQDNSLLPASPSVPVAALVLRPNPGFVLEVQKKSSGRTLFINVCHHPDVGKLDRQQHNLSSAGAAARHIGNEAYPEHPNNDILLGALGTCGELREGVTKVRGGEQEQDPNPLVIDLVISSARFDSMQAADKDSGQDEIADMVLTFICKLFRVKLKEDFDIYNGNNSKKETKYRTASKYFGLAWAGAAGSSSFSLAVARSSSDNSVAAKEEKRRSPVRSLVSTSMRSSFRSSVKRIKSAEQMPAPEKPASKPMPVLNVLARTKDHGAFQLAPVFTGTLFKQGRQLIKSWTFRTMQLKGTILRYYDQSQFKGLFDIKDCVLEELLPEDTSRQNTFPFRLTAPASRKSEVLTLAAETAEERQRWLDILYAALLYEGASTAVLSCPPSKTGFLKKTGHFMSTVHRRFFVLDMGVISYFEKEDPAAVGKGVNLKGQMHLSGANAEWSAGGLTLNITNNSKDVKTVAARVKSDLLLTAEKLQEAQEWRDSVADHIVFADRQTLKASRRPTAARRPAGPE